MRVLRTTAVIPLSLAAAWLLLRWSGDLLTGGLVRVDAVVALGAAVTGSAVAFWYASTAVALLLAELAGLSRRTARVAPGLRAAVARVGAPVLRRATVVGVGAGLALSAVPAGAEMPLTVGTSTAAPAASRAADDDAVPLDLRPGSSNVDEPSASGRVPVEEGTHPSTDEEAPAPTSTDRPGESPPSPGTSEADLLGPPTPGADGPGASPGGGDAHVPFREADDDVTTTVAEDRACASRATSAGGASTGITEERYVVRRGDSLWAIAGSHLGRGATAAEVAAEWPRWYETNRAVVGTDPDLIHPGQELLTPDSKDMP